MATKTTREIFKQCNAGLPVSCCERNKADWKVLASTPTDVSSEGCDGSLSHQNHWEKKTKQNSRTGCEFIAEQLQLVYQCECLTVSAAVFLPTHSCAYLARFQGGRREQTHQK